MEATEVVTLPPGVTGKEKGQLVVSLGRFRWEAPSKPPRVPYAVLHWWGDPGAGVSMPLLPGSQSGAARVR